jgi:hypothetical protein
MEGSFTTGPEDGYRKTGKRLEVRGKRLEVGGWRLEVIYPLPLTSYPLAFLGGRIWNGSGDS